MLSVQGDWHECAVKGDEGTFFVSYSGVQDPTCEDSQEEDEGGGVESLCDNTPFSLLLHFFSLSAFVVVAMHVCGCNASGLSSHDWVGMRAKQRRFFFILIPLSSDDFCVRCLLTVTPLARLVMISVCGVSSLSQLLLVLWCAASHRAVLMANPHPHLVFLVRDVCDR